MTDATVYLSAVKKLSERGLNVSNFVQVAESLVASGSPDLAIDLYRRWIAAEPAHPLQYVVLFNYGLLLLSRGDLKTAREALELAVGFKPDFAPSRTLLGEIYERLGDGEKAIAQWTMITDRPAVVSGAAVGSALNALKSIGRVLQAGRQPERLATVLQRGHEIAPRDHEIVQILLSLRLQQCEWPITSVPGLDRKTLLRNMGAFQLILYTDDPLLHLAAAWEYNKNTIGYHDPCPQVRPRAANPGRLRIGYLSADLTSHSTGYLMSEVFELHDRSKVEVFAYYCGAGTPDPTKARIRAAVEHWVDISGMDDATAARKIADDGIDILVDLNGTTRGNRIRLIATRPAPVIVNWVAYPGTMGSPYHHYLIADEWIIPKSHEIYYAEKVARLPCYQPNDRKREIAPRPSRAEVGLPADAMVYCCFNGSVKITRFTFERWMTILGRVPGSVLWLLDGGEEMRRRLTEYAGARGISAERLIFAPSMRRSQHLARYALADLFLDTTPCGAHTTASDALWMGVPIVTLPGRGFASRVCSSLARAAGLPEAVCSTPEEYVERAVSLGTNRAELQKLKQRLAKTRDTCLLFDMENLVSHLERLYRQMWKEFHQGERPRPDLRNLDVYLDIALEADHDAAERQMIADYQGWYRERLIQRHLRCPIPADSRLWTETDIARAETAGPSSAIVPDRSKPRSRKQAARRQARRTR